jgi:hypothetical protein
MKEEAVEVTDVSGSDKYYEKAEAGLEEYVLP